MASGGASAPGTPTAVRVDDLTLDTARYAVFRGPDRLPLPRLTFELLRTLVSEAPGVVTYDRLAQRVWRGRPVSPETIAQRVSLLRRALGDDPDRPRYIRVLRGVGVQLVAEVGAGPARPASPAASAPWGDEAAGEAVPQDLSLPAQPSLVVLPFGAGAAPREAAFAAAMTQDLITRLGRMRAFFVIARGTAFRLGNARVDPRELPRRLGVRYVVQGGVRLDGDRLRVEVSLADAVDGRELWADSIHAAQGDVFDVQEAIALRVAGAIASEIELAEQHRARLAPFASLDAWSAYHLGCWHMYRFTAGDYEIAQRCFERAITLDPMSSRALAGLSFVHWQRAFLEISPDRAGEVSRALDLAVRSLDADPRDPLAHWAFGRARLLQGHVDDAVAELEVTTTLNPSFAVGQYTLGFAQMQAGDLAASIEHADRARRLSPYDPLAFAMIGLRGFSLALRGEVSEAASQMACAIRQPHAHYHMVAMAAVCDVLDGRGDAAQRDWQRLREARPGYDVRTFLRAFRLQSPTHIETVEGAFRHLARNGP